MWGSLLSLLSGIMRFFNRERERDAGRNEERVKNLEAENAILKKQLENQIKSGASADAYWVQRDSTYGDK